MRLHCISLYPFYFIQLLNRNATSIEIKDAYRKLAFSLHPDRHDGCQIKTNQFKQATEAYQILSGMCVWM
jgi:DnaJ-class molecular chaperone